ncbi:hypothetical protein N7499_005668 [Penicillium canescens]|nr:hypothetical protein N7522_009595 [Penicillium canescens]KAJ6080794.1 hypothetical protein N7499_005668 [Penicillium canescens]KAJ6177412.1 hypothetical protein N7485_004326 [Penicillium canescens]
MMKNKTCDECHRIFKFKALREAHGQCVGVRKRAPIPSSTSPVLVAAKYSRTRGAANYTQSTARTVFAS